MKGIEPSLAFVAEEDWERWMHDPVTRFVAASYEAVRAKQLGEWLRLSWEGGSADQDVLTELRTREDCYAGFSETTYLGHAMNLRNDPKWLKWLEKREADERDARAKNGR